MGRNCTWNFALPVVFLFCCSVSILEYYISHEVPILQLFYGNNGRTELNSACYQHCLESCSSTHQSQQTPPISTLSSATLTNNDTKYLDSYSLHKYHACTTTARAKIKTQGQHHCHKHRSFLNRTTTIVALISFPGSGNSWVRHILEQSTGIYTGSIYCDPTLKAAFPGEFIDSGNVLVVKTHRFDSIYLPKEAQDYYKQQKFTKAILIVRDPYDALVSEANRQWSTVQRTEKHLGLAKESNFIGNPQWDWFVEYKGFIWYMTLNTWLKESHIPVHVVQYERLKTDLAEEVLKMTDFLNINVSNETMQCVLSNNEGLYRRSKHLNFDPFSKELKIITNRILKKGNSILKKYGIQYEVRGGE